MKKKNLNGVARVRFCDFSNYDPNGGKYGFWTDYTRQENGSWEVSYGTTADFPFCPVCGDFDDHYEGDDCFYDSGYGCGEFATVTETELLKLINEFEETDDEYIEFK